METDEELMKIYWRGWHNELDSITPLEKLDTELKQRAYDLGKIDAIMGDDVSSIDMQSKEEILKSIRMKKQ